MPFTIQLFTGENAPYICPAKIYLCSVMLKMMLIVSRRCYIWQAKWDLTFVRVKRTYLCQVKMQFTSVKPKCDIAYRRIKGMLQMC